MTDPSSRQGQDSNYQTVTNNWLNTKRDRLADRQSRCDPDKNSQLEESRYSERTWARKQRNSHGWSRHQATTGEDTAGWKILKT
jgi:hypothetical protein